MMLFAVVIVSSDVMMRRLTLNLAFAIALLFVIVSTIVVSCWPSSDPTLCTP